MQSDEESDCELVSVSSHQSTNELQDCWNLKKRQREDILVRLAQLKQEVENILKAVDMNQNDKKAMPACPVVQPKDNLIVSSEKTELANKLELRDAIKEES